MHDVGFPPPRRIRLRFLTLLLALAAGDGFAAVHALSGASGDTGALVDSKPGAPLDPVFDCYAANSAWGLSYSGKVVDRAGQVWSYRVRGRTLPAASDEKGRSYLAAADLAAKFADATAAAQIDVKLLAEQTALIDRAGSGTVESSDTGVRDAGTSTCHGYVYDAAARRYRDVLLGSDGGVADRRFVNGAAEAKTLLDWLRSIGVAR